MQTSHRETESIWSVANGWRIHARASLDHAPAFAPDVVLVHGLVISSRYMTPLAEQLAPHYRVYAPDLPGFGESDEPGHTLTIPELADALLLWMDSVGLERPLILGNSFGCQIASEFAFRYPARVRRLILVGPTVDPQARNFASQAARWIRNATTEPPSLGVSILRDYLKAGLVRTLKTMRIFTRDRIDARLPLIPTPTLVVRGTNDPIVPRRWAKEAVRMLPIGELVELPEVGHTANYSAPEELARLVKRFDEYPDHVDAIHQGGSHA